MKKTKTKPNDPSHPPVMQARASGADKTITACPVISIYPDTIAKAPRRIGFNVEIQTDADRLNLWDWLADSGATVVREFHPEKNLRRTPVQPGRFGKISCKKDFDGFRKRAVTNPDRTVDFGNYAFAVEMPYLGTPDRIVEYILSAGILPMIPMGYVPKMFPRPLVRDPERLDPAGDSDIDWEAAASAYEYYFAMAYHFASKYECRYFMMVNEPEYRGGGFYLPRGVQVHEQDLFRKLFVELRDLTLWNTFFRALSVQMAVLTRIARIALDDVQKALSRNKTSARLLLTGPVAGNLDAYWAGVGPHVDFCDYHQYSPHPESYRERFSRAAHLTRGTDKGVIISEFNRQAGEMRVSGMYFSMPESIGLARILMEIMQVSRSSDPVLEAATLYHFHFPATHRNYKSLVFGDMNRVDWSGTDARPSGKEMDPSVEELQIRHATPAYHIFKMLSRASGFSPSDGRPYPVLRTSMMIRDSALVPDMSSTTRILAVDRKDSLVVSILNSDPSRGDVFTLNMSALPRRFKWAVVRETSVARWDQVVAEMPVTDGEIKLAIAPESLVQVILSNIDPASIRSCRICEHGLTRGKASSLDLFQTTRLRLMARINGKEVDISEHNVVWASEDSQFLHAGPCGLILRKRSTARPLRITASLANGRQLAELVFPPNRSAVLPQTCSLHQP